MLLQTLDTSNILFSLTPLTFDGVTDTRYQQYPVLRTPLTVDGVADTRH